MNQPTVVLALITRDNDYQAEQAAAATDAANRQGIKLQVIYAGNDAVNQTQQLVKIIQDAGQRPNAIVVEPVGTDMVQVARAAVMAGIGWAVLNRDPDYISPLALNDRAPIFSVTIDQQEVGRIQGRQIAALLSEGNILYIEGPFSSSVSALRSKGMLAAKPRGVEVKVLKGDWTERSANHAVKSWLALSTSRQLQIQALVCQNDAMAMGARKAFADLTEKDREHWLSIPFTGCDGVSKTGQEWVRRGVLKATVITPATAGVAIEIIAKALQSGTKPPGQTLIAPQSFPEIKDLIAKQREANLSPALKI